jgi:7,8-dihydro-6-hydroxymethylpterin-pyrophosphokinase
LFNQTTELGGYFTDSFAAHPAIMRLSIGGSLVNTAQPRDAQQLSNPAHFRQAHLSHTELVLKVDMIAKERPVSGTKQQRWMNLCEQARNEQDPRVLSEVFTKIDRMLQSKQDRLNGPHLSAGGSTTTR